MEEKRKLINDAREVTLEDLPDGDVKEIRIREKEKKDKEHKLSIEDRIKQAIENPIPYADSLMQQTFSCVKSVSAVQGLIKIEANSTRSAQVALERAEKELGPEASAIQVMARADQLRYKDTLMSPKKFVKILMLIGNNVAQTPYYFGEGTGGGTIRDIWKDSWKAVRDTMEWHRKNQLNIDPEIKKLVDDPRFLTTDPDMFPLLIGKYWKEDERLRRDNTEAAARLL